MFGMKCTPKKANMEPEKKGPLEKENTSPKHQIFGVPAVSFFRGPRAFCRMLFPKNQWQIKVKFGILGSHKSMEKPSRNAVAQCSARDLWCQIWGTKHQQPR